MNSLSTLIDSLTRFLHQVQQCRPSQLAWAWALLTTPLFTSALLLLAAVGG